MGLSRNLFCILQNIYIVQYIQLLFYVRSIFASTDAIHIWSVSTDAYVMNIHVIESECMKMCDHSKTLCKLLSWCLLK